MRGGRGVVGREMGRCDVGQISSEVGEGTGGIRTRLSTIRVEFLLDCQIVIHNQPHCKFLIARHGGTVC